jgi:adenylate cyclase
MLAGDEDARACELGLELVERFEREPDFPAVRVGLAGGPVISLVGDYFGEVVNLAARLVSVAEPATLVVDDRVREAAGDRFEIEPWRAPELKGFLELPSVYRVWTRTA